MTKVIYFRTKKHRHANTKNTSTERPEYLEHPKKEIDTDEVGFGGVGGNAYRQDSGFSRAVGSLIAQFDRAPMFRGCSGRIFHAC
jgi:hypothetical protein